MQSESVQRKEKKKKNPEHSSPAEKSWCSRFDRAATCALKLQIHINPCNTPASYLTHSHEHYLSLLHFLPAAHTYPQLHQHEALYRGSLLGKFSLFSKENSENKSLQINQRDFLSPQHRSLNVSATIGWTVIKLGTRFWFIPNFRGIAKLMTHIISLSSFFSEWSH